MDARDENGDPLTLTIHRSNADAVDAELTGNVLALSPAPGASDTASTITVRAEAGGRFVEKSFVAMVSDQDVAFGKSFTVGGVFADQCR